MLENQASRPHNGISAAQKTAWPCIRLGVTLEKHGRRLNISLQGTCADLGLNQIHRLEWNS